MSHAGGRLSARPRAGTVHEPGGTGERGLELGRRRRDGLLYVPLKYHPARPAPVVVLLHGAGGDARGTLPILRAEADLRGAIVLVPESAASTWDVIAGQYGPDVAFIDRALESLFERYAVNPERIAVAGFSDGASYALSLGLANGDLFRDILAFSPGFAAPAQVVGRPRVFISHGDDDRVLPIDRCGRPLSKRLAKAGYDVDYREFQGGHVVPPELVRAAMQRFLR
ncbi:MAG: phospholipase [Proteobacteria bacterium]|nr:phospholipase [Pseudomonadota bacterium]MBW3617964.1 phospholipase [Pseudomonadota bacterium]